MENESLSFQKEKRKKGGRKLCMLCCCLVLVGGQAAGSMLFVIWSSRRSSRRQYAVCCLGFGEGQVAGQCMKPISVFFLFFFEQSLQVTGIMVGADMQLCVFGKSATQVKEGGESGKQGWEEKEGVQRKKGRNWGRRREIS